MSTTIRSLVRQTVLLASSVLTTSVLNLMLFTSSISIPAYQLTSLSILLSLPQPLIAVSKVVPHRRSPFNPLAHLYFYFFNLIDFCLSLANLYLALAVVCLSRDAGKNDLSISGGNYVYLFF